MVSFEGVKDCVVTFRNNAANPPVVGAPVKISGNGEAAGCVSGERFVGIALGSDGNYCAVLISGYVRMPYTSTKPSYGIQKLSGNGAGGVKMDSANGRDAMVVEVDADSLTVGLILIA